MARHRLLASATGLALLFSLSLTLGLNVHTTNAALPHIRPAIPAVIGDQTTRSAAGDFGSPIFNQIEQRGVLRVGTLSDYPPIAAVDPKTGKQVGFENDLARDMAAAMGVKIQFVDVPFSTLIAGLQAGKFDIIAAQMAIKAQRALAIDFTKPWEAVGDSLVVLKSSGVTTSNAVSILNNSSHSISLILGGVEEQTRAQIFPKAKVVAVTGESDEFLNLLSRRVNAVITDNVSAAVFAKNHPEVTVLFDGSKVPFLANFPSATGVPKGNLEFVHWVDDWMAKEVDSGRYAQLWHQDVGGQAAISQLQLERGQF